MNTENSISKDASEIRVMMNDVSKILNESYNFPIQKTEIQEKSPEMAQVTEKAPVSNVDEKIKQIRKIALEVMSELTPEDEAYKMITAIFNSCDKALSNKEVKKDAEPIEQTNNHKF